MMGFTREGSFMNSTVLKNRKKVILFLICMAVCFLGLGVNCMIHAEESVCRIVESYLEQREVDVREVNLQEDMLIVKLQSQGDSRCTLNDVQAIEVIYEFLCDADIAKRVKDIKIEIYDINQKCIYDYLQKDIAFYDLGMVKSEYAEVTNNEVEDYLTSHYGEVFESILFRREEAKYAEITVKTRDGEEIGRNEIYSIINAVQSDLQLDKQVANCILIVIGAQNNIEEYFIYSNMCGYSLAWVSPNAQSDFIQ